MHGTISDLVASYGYVFLFLLVGIESFGVPMPGETALVTAAALAVLVFLAMPWFRRNRDRIGVSVTERWQEIARSPRFAGIRDRHPKLWSFVAARSLVWSTWDSTSHSAFSSVSLRSGCSGA